MRSQQTQHAMTESGGRTDNVGEALAAVLAAFEAGEALDGAEETVLLFVVDKIVKGSNEGGTHPPGSSSTQTRRLLTLTLLGRVTSRGRHNACTSLSFNNNTNTVFA